MKARIQKLGISLAVRIPASLASKAGFIEGSRVELSVSKDTLTVRAVPIRTYTLAQLLKGMTPKKTHPEVDWGPPQGREVW